MVKNKRKTRKDGRIKEDFRSELTDATHLDGMSKEEMDRGKGKDKKDKKAYEETFLGRTMARFSMNKHRKMERTLRSFVMASSVLLVGGGYALYSAHQNSVAEAHRETPIDGVVSFSKTQTNFTVGQVYRSTDNRTAYIPLRFDRMDELSTDANDYTILLYNESEEYTYKADMKLVLFGTTGHAAIVVNGAPEIGSEPLRVFLRNDKTMSGVLQDEATNSAGTGVDMKAASEEFDIAMFMVNPGAGNVLENKPLSTDNLDITKLYRELVSQPDVAEIKESIVESRESIDSIKELVNEYEARLKRAGYTIPERKPFMKDDWMPANRAPVDVDSSLENGFVIDEDASEPILDEGAQNADLVLESEAEYFEYDKELKRDDGVLSSDITDDSAVASQEDWVKLQSLYERIRKEKEFIYVEQGYALARIQAELERQSRTATIADDARFKLIGDVKLSGGVVVPKDNIQQKLTNEKPETDDISEEKPVKDEEKPKEKTDEKALKKTSDNASKKEKEDAKKSKDAPKTPAKVSKDGSIEPSKGADNNTPDDAS